MNGGEGNDSIQGQLGNDLIAGGPGNDGFGQLAPDDDFGQIETGLFGGPGDDVIDGGLGLDVAAGDEGDDRMTMGPDRDNCAGEQGQDSCDGGDPVEKGDRTDFRDADYCDPGDGAYLDENPTEVCTDAYSDTGHGPIPPPSTTFLLHW